MNQIDYLVRRIGYNNYSQYLKSDHWKNICLYYKNKKCFCCNFTRKLQLHHKSYVNIGNETQNDVITLCNKCHLNVHELIRNGSNKLSVHYELRKKIRNKKYKKYKKSKMLIELEYFENYYKQICL